MPIFGVITDGNSGYFRLQSFGERNTESVPIYVSIQDKAIGTSLKSPHAVIETTNEKVGAPVGTKPRTDMPLE